ncbi:MYND-type domain-containing protein [Caenorhabditis elegans]|uniref:MYND-type domain-containing protein n=1 Tax=Caenorhabditis elegans TaxID=6239 RepID=Q23084_CAEEL|nr:MYND-type domain-containing protein [Caenorhabditis elegans]CCD73128.1 MYND-type domain-containing protein [Caenorhabditis elegans]|eukprot:NP_508850.2 SET (trithorax/polycomb) domain containing [Caenorhabditis elegans]
MSSGDAPLEVVGVEKIGSKPRSKEFYPFAYSLLDCTKDDYCWTCLGENVELTCEQCKVAKFCSKQCETSGAIDHKYECGPLKKCPDLNTDERMLIRIVGRYKDIHSGKDKSIDGFYNNRESKRSVMEIWEHCADMKKDENAMKSFKKTYDRVKQFGDTNHLMDEEVTFQLHSRNFINRHSISNVDYLREIGKGLYLDLCKYDHSCRPNAIYSCNGIVAKLRALHDNVDLENVETTHYTYIELPPCKIQRRHMLKETWYFECHCERCDDPDDNWLTSVLCPVCISKTEYRKTIKLHGPEAYANPETLEIVCDRCSTTLDREYIFMALDGMRTIRRTVEGAEDETKDPIELLKIYQGALMTYERILPMSNAYFCQLIAAMIPLISRVSMTKKERLVASLDLHLKCETFVRYVYRHAHPSKAMHFLQMGQLHLELANDKDAARCLIEAHRIMDYLFGADHFLSKQTKGFMDHALSSLMQFQRNFVNVLDRVPEAKQALEERFMTADEKKALKDSEKNKRKRNNKKNKKIEQKNEQKSSGENGNSKTKGVEDGLEDLPELVAEM